VQVGVIADLEVADGGEFAGGLNVRLHPPSAQEEGRRDVVRREEGHDLGVIPGRFSVWQQSKVSATTGWLVSTRQSASGSRGVGAVGGAGLSAVALAEAEVGAVVGRRFIAFVGGVGGGEAAGWVAGSRRPAAGSGRRGTHHPTISPLRSCLR